MITIRESNTAPSRSCPPGAPEKPASGGLLLRVPPEVHSSALVAVHPPGQSFRRLT